MIAYSYGLGFGATRPDRWANRSLPKTEPIEHPARWPMVDLMGRHMPSAKDHFVGGELFCSVMFILHFI